ncbi:MAG: S41 family peptidase, partial [Eubacterium sp.]
KQGNRKDYRATSEDQVTVPVTVLVNEGTASASEILAGAIQDTQAGTLIGTKTFGKGIVQEVISLMDGTGYKLTNAEYFTPNGRNIHGVGLTPDVEINQNESYKDTLVVPEDQDTQLQKALEVLQSKM